MHFDIHFGQTETASSTSPVTVGWLLQEVSAGVIFDPPIRVKSAAANRDHAKSASRCPAITSLESRYFAVNCPYDLQLAFTRNDDGNPDLVNLLGDKSPTKLSKLRKILHMTDEAAWRYEDKPTLQLELPYIFVSDEPVYISQVAPFMHYNANPWPGTIFGGRFPINVWPRPLMWAFEWHDISKPLILKRGEPLFYVQFETQAQNRQIRLVEAKRTEALQEYLELIGGAVGYVNQTFSLFKAAEERRPKTLVEPVTKK